VKLHAFLPQNRFRRQQILALPVSPQRNHMGMLAEQKHILNRAGFSRGNNALLQGVRFRVSHQSKVDNVARIQGSAFGER
jgi:hypothetical protein